MTIENSIRYSYNDLKEHIEVFTQLQDPKYLKILDSIAQRLIEMYDWVLLHKTGNKSYWFGNGGSAEQSHRFSRLLMREVEYSDDTARHLATEFTIRFKRERLPLPAIPLPAEFCSLSAAGNDFDYIKHGFDRQIGAYIIKNDVVVGISTSGKSENVINGLELAKRLGATTAAFTGKNGLQRFTPDYLFAVPSEKTSVIQVCHLWGGQLICDIVDQYFAERYGSK
ncbi:MAG: SIS domain-containing protein [Nanoarchaeota archaeon]